MDIRSLSGSVTLKGLMIAALVLVLLIPLTMLRGLTSERAGMREQAYAKVAHGWGGDVAIGGPILIIPTERTVMERGEPRIERCNLHLLPAMLDIVGALALDPEPRRVGLYAVPVYLSRVQLKGRFDFTRLQPLLDRPGVTYLWSQSRLHLPIGAVRGLREITSAQAAGADVEFGPAGAGLYPGLEASIDLTASRAQPAHFSIALTLAGSRHWSVLPTGSQTRVSLQADWPHPAFDGAFLPMQRSISSDGFTAQWQVLELNRAYPQVWSEGEVNEAMLTGSIFGVELHQPVDIYQRGERAVKYALVFIALTFLTFFAWEQLSAVRLHPLQYLLVGLALSTFYLLLIALSEHIAFGLAYAIAASALTALLGVYVAGALDSRARGVAVAVAMALVYSVLYVLVLSEDYALLLGAITVFAALAGLMLATRKVNWYRSAAPAAES